MVELRRRLVDRRPWLREPWWAEVGSGSAAVLWSTLALGFAARLMDLSSMRVLLTVADEQAWQAGGIAIGVAQLAAAFVDSPWARWAVSIVALWWWTCLFAMIALVTTTPSLALYAVMAAFNLVPMFRLLVLRIP